MKYIFCFILSALLFVIALIWFFSFNKALDTAIDFYDNLIGDMIDEHFDY